MVGTAAAVGRSPPCPEKGRTGFQRAELGRAPPGSPTAHQAESPKSPIPAAGSPGPGPPSPLRGRDTPGAKTSPPPRAGTPISTSRGRGRTPIPTSARPVSPPGAGQGRAGLGGLSWGRRRLPRPAAASWGRSRQWRKRAASGTPPGLPRAGGRAPTSTPGRAWGAHPCSPPPRTLLRLPPCRPARSSAAAPGGSRSPPGCPRSPPGASSSPPLRRGRSWCVRAEPPSPGAAGPAGAAAPPGLARPAFLILFLLLPGQCHPQGCAPAASLPSSATG